MQSEQAFYGRPPEATERKELIIFPPQLRYLTSLALMDNTLVGDQIRNAISEYDSSSYELRFLLSPIEREVLSENPGYEVPGQLVTVKYTPEELDRHERVIARALEEGLGPSYGLHAVLRGYIQMRRRDPELEDKAHAAMERHRQRLA